MGFFGYGLLEISFCSLGHFEVNKCVRMLLLLSGWFQL